MYFAQFSNDTNADSRIDGNDNGVLFRIPATRITDANAVILPEQLTTAEQNCNYPAPGRDYLYMTCAFEGTLMSTEFRSQDLCQLFGTKKFF